MAGIVPEQANGTIVLENKDVYLAVIIDVTTCQTTANNAFKWP